VQYAVHAPSAELADVVECLWTLEGDARELDGGAQSVLPDGRPELILHFGDAFDRIGTGGATERQARMLFAGQLTSQLLLRPSGRIAILGVRLHPYGAGALLRTPVHELEDLTIDVDAVDRRLARDLLEVRDSADSLDAAIPSVLRRLEARAASSRVDPFVRHAVAAIDRRAGQISIERLAAHLGVTRRQLERRFRALVGLSPKRLARIVRLQRALQMLDDIAAPNRGAVTAAACGYADQAHFIRDCRELCGHAPAALLATRAELTGLFLTGPDPV
jgi:AraC-like DNA-binding protein